MIGGRETGRNDTSKALILAMSYRKYHTDNIAFKVKAEKLLS